MWRDETESQLNTRELGVWDFDFDGAANIAGAYIVRLRGEADEPFGMNSIAIISGAGYRLSDS